MTVTQLGKAHGATDAPDTSSERRGPRPGVEMSTWELCNGLMPVWVISWLLAAGLQPQVLSHSGFIPRGGWDIAWDQELNPEAMVRVCYPPLAPPLAPLALSGLPCGMRIRNTQETPPVSWQDSLLNYRHLVPWSNSLPEDGALRAEQDFCPL